MANSILVQRERYHDSAPRCKSKLCLSRSLSTVWTGQLKLWLALPFASLCFVNHTGDHHLHPEYVVSIMSGSFEWVCVASVHSLPS
jgi:hypothetical protein